MQVSGLDDRVGASSVAGVAAEEQSVGISIVKLFLRKTVSNRTYFAEAVMLQWSGVAGTPGQNAALVISSPGKFTDNQFTTNWDKEFRGGNDRLSFRFFWSDNEQFQPFGADSFGIQTGGAASANNLNFLLDIPLRNRFGGVTLTHLFTPTLVAEFRFGVTVISYHFGNVPIVTAQDQGINRPTNNGTPDIYRFSFASFQLGPYPAQLQSSLGDSLSYADTLSYTRGKHTLRFGGEFDRTTTTFAPFTSEIGTPRLVQFAQRCAF
jgi:hypothetical protein